MDTIGKYQLVRVIGEGGMGRVYEALDPDIGRRVAIKTISLNVAADSETRSRFFREAQAAGRLSHPNLITIHDIGDADGTPYIVMELLEGMDLSRKSRQERLSYDAKIQIMVDVCEGLAFAHGHDIVHRDIKPANIFITTNGHAKILDFGLARGIRSDVTQTGKIVGTPNYMSPEQIRGDDVDHRSDIFATGVVFYELLCGRKAFEGDTVATTLYRVLETQPPPVHQIDVQLPSALSAVIERALAKDRLDRFQTSSAMLDAVQQAHDRTTPIERSNLRTLPGHMSPPAASRQTRRSVSQVTAWAVAGVAIAVAMAAGFILSRQPEQRTRPSPSVAIPVSGSPATSQTVPGEPARPAPPARVAPPLPPDDNKVVKPATPRPATVIVPRAVRVPSPPAIEPPPVAPEAKIIAAAPPPAVVPSAPQEPKATPTQPLPATAPALAPPAPPPPAPPAHTEENAVTAVPAVLARYRAALESRDLSALKRIWPALAGRQEDAIRAEFEHARTITVGIDGVVISPTSNGANVIGRRSYAVTTDDGQTLKTTTRMVMTLIRRDGAWSIETIRHEVAR